MCAARTWSWSPGSADRTSSPAAWREGRLLARGGWVGTDIPGAVRLQGDEFRPLSLHRVPLRSRRGSGRLRRHHQLLHVVEGHRRRPIDGVDAGDAVVRDARQTVLGDEIAVVAGLLQLGEVTPVVDRSAERGARALHDLARGLLDEVPGAVVRQPHVPAAGANRFAHVVVALSLLEE